MKFRIWTGLAVVLTVIAAMVWAADKSDEPAGQVNTTKIALNTDIDKTSYALGVQIGKQLKGAEVNVDVLKQGLSDQMAGRELAMSDEDCQKELQVFSRMMQQKQMAERDALGQKNIQEGKVFLEANAKKEGIVTLPSGLQYQIITQGTGPKPTAKDQVTVQYKGTFIDGTEFDSSYKRGKPATFPLDGVIKGWTEGLQLLNEGGKMKLFVPSDLGYGPSGRGNIEPSKTLIFEVELLKVNPAQTPPAPAGR